LPQDGHFAVPFPPQSIAEPSEGNFCPRQYQINQNGVVFDELLKRL
jgi:hypothetical protein